MAAKADDTIDHVEAAASAPEVVAPATTNDIEKQRKIPKSAAELQADKAAEFLKQMGHTVVLTPEDNRRVLSKIDWRILPIILFVYCLQSLDKTSLSYASVFGLVADTGLVGDQYSWLGSVVYLAQLFCQPLVAYSLVRFPIGKFCAVMVLCWGAVLCFMAAAHNFAGLMATRLLLGMFESSVAPTFVAVVQMWYRRREQTKRNAAWYAMLGVVNILGSLLTYGLGHIKSDVLKPYQIIFLFCGLLTVVFSIVIFLFMPDSPIEAKFLNDEDKLVALERLRMNQMGMGSGVFKWDHVREAMLDLKTWIWFLLMFIISIPSGGISTFGPLIVQSFGFDSFTTILFNIPFGAIQMIATLGGAFLADKIKMKSPVLLLLCLPPIAGCAMLIAFGRSPSDRGPLLAAYYILSFYPGISPLIYSWSGQCTGGDTKRKVTTAMLFIGSNAGNVIGPLLFRTDEKPRYDRGLRASLGLFVALAVVTIAGMLWIRILNGRQAAKRVAMGKSAVIQDLSMADSKQVADGEGPAMLNQVADEHVGEHGLDDITDLQNEDFIYVY
ncbi:major facilitator superfamily domain-containing protein [Microdochium trichocladiopsis]|uniref:Major facilitator superfamily domain-containing protein n=1 Tax=Microdochium trichocladiopsis TaxID=1682393 RepID=A0A9P8YD70_9PEZI|nr:major facilitator superfamily domain-containing protein [Microdochium trichocladiopsis]KAH7037069.1 major facilitator superfamily domain-containing protein [Microdochium trichocladiopsis]